MRFLISITSYITISNCLFENLRILENYAFISINVDVNGGNFISDNITLNNNFFENYIISFSGAYQFISLGSMNFSNNQNINSSYPIIYFHGCNFSSVEFVKNIFFIENTIGIILIIFFI